MKSKKFILALLVSAVLTLGILMSIGAYFTMAQNQSTTSTVAIKQVSQSISGAGSIHSSSEATLHFQTGGKVVYLPFKQGDTVQQGQTIAQLDTYALQKQLQATANAYQIATNNNATVQEDNQAAVIEGQTRSALDATNHNTYPNITETGLITDTVNRMVQNSMLTQNTAQLQVDLSNYAVQLASLTAPFTGTLLAEDITTPGVNVTTATSFTLADPTQKVFRAQIAASDIDFVSVGSKATVKLDGQNKTLTGTVVTIYPQKQTLPTGEEVYVVDIAIDGLTNAAFGQNGSVLITSNNQTATLMVPTWTIVGHTSVWVMSGQQAVLKNVQVGVIHGDMTEIVSGLSDKDKVILSPEDIARKVYQLL